MMAIILGILVTLLVIPQAVADFSGNLNYNSPSGRDVHADLGIDVPLVTRRSLKRDNVPYQPSDLTFTHGVASGDPYPESVILWTRIAPTSESDNSNATVEGTVPLYSHDTQTYINANPSPICVEWEVLEYQGSNVVSKGQAYTTSDIDYTVKVEAGGLQPWTVYNYQFTVCGSNNSSPLGRTKTSPESEADVDEVRLAVFSCSNYPSGYFNAYGNAARKDEHDYVVHLGDYIYEGKGEGKRASKPPGACLSLHDYRTRHNQYRTDLDLQLLSQNFAWISTWDDHEVSNNGFRDGSSTLNNTEESFLRKGHGVSVDQRKMNAVRAYFEWIPIRQIDMDDNLRVWRSFQLGKMMDLVVLDTRNYDRSITDLKWNTDYIEMINNDAGRSMMGSRQENWFYNSLNQSQQRSATWRVIANQVLFSDLITNQKGHPEDSWSGYIANRNRTFKYIYDNNITNTIFLAGDSHKNWVSDLAWIDEKPYDPVTGDGAIGVEFAGTAVSSTGFEGPIQESFFYSQNLLSQNTVLQWQDGYYRGYFTLVASKDKIEAQYYGSPSVASRNSFDLPLANFTVEAGSNKLSRPIAGGSVEAGCGRGILTQPTNYTLDTDTQQWMFVGFDVMYIDRKASDDSDSDDTNDDTSNAGSKNAASNVSWQPCRRLHAYIVMAWVAVLFAW